MTNPNIAEVIANDISAYKGENMLAVVSGYHAAGKTWFSISLAQVLSQYKKKILVVDTSKGINNVKMQLGLQNNHDLDQVVYGHSSINQVITPYPKGHFDVILSNPNSSCLNTMSQGSLQIFGGDLNIVAQNYDTTILDIDTGESLAVNALAGMAKTVIIVSSENLSSLTESCELIRHFTLHYPQSKLKIVINYVNSFIEGQRAYESLKSACQQHLEYVPELLGVIRQDARVRDSIRSQSTILNRYPSSEASLDIITIGKRIIQEI